MKVRVFIMADILNILLCPPQPAYYPPAAPMYQPPPQPYYPPPPMMQSSQQSNTTVVLQVRKKLNVLIHELTMQSKMCTGHRKYGISKGDKYLILLHSIPLVLILILILTLTLILIHWIFW